MNFRKNPPPEPQVDLTSLIDVVFLLLIFFMVATQFKQKSSVKIALPEASTEQPAETGPVLEVIVDAQGQYEINQQILATQDRQALTTALQAVSKPANTALVIRADGHAPYQAVITVMDVAQSLGLSNIRFITQPLSP